MPAESLLELEITETTIMVDPARAAVILSRLSAMGVSLSIDDFGTGYSSLAYLKRLPVDEIKIDKSFVLNMASDKSDAVIVRSTIELARNLGLRVVAEGVESEQVWNQLLGVRRRTAQASPEPWMPPEQRPRAAGGDRAGRRGWPAGCMGARSPACPRAARLPPERRRNNGRPGRVAGPVPLDQGGRECNASGRPGPVAARASTSC